MNKAMTMPLSHLLNGAEEGSHSCRKFQIQTFANSRRENSWTPALALPKMAKPKTMKAVVFDGPYKVSVQDRPVPQ